jgi:hypothetical protein
MKAHYVLLNSITLDLRGCELERHHLFVEKFVKYTLRFYLESFLIH